MSINIHYMYLVSVHEELRLTFQEKFIKLLLESYNYKTNKVETNNDLFCLLAFHNPRRSN